MADAAVEVDAKAGSMQTAKDLFAGAVGGIAQVLIGQFQVLHDALKVAKSAIYALPKLSAHLTKLGRYRPSSEVLCLGALMPSTVQSLLWR